MGNRYELSVVVPTYKSSEMLNVLMDRIEAALTRSGLTYEVVLVDDCSPDNTWDKVSEICGTKKWVVGIRLGKNVGQWKSSLLGMSKTRGKFIVTIDDDLEYDPEDIIALYQYLKADNHGIVFGMAKAKYRVKEQNQSLAGFRNFLLNLFWQKPPTDSFKILKRELVFSNGNFLPKVHFEAYMKHMLSKESIGYCNVAYRKRYIGSSNHSHIKKLRLFFLFTKHYYSASSSLHLSESLISDARNLTPG